MGIKIFVKNMSDMGVCSIVSLMTDGQWANEMRCVCLISILINLHSAHRCGRDCISFIKLIAFELFKFNSQTRKLKWNETLNEKPFVGIYGIIEPWNM